jgi:hypothetical protein
MKELLLAAALGLAVGAGANASTLSQHRVAECNKEAGDRKGDERRAFTKACIKAKQENPEKLKAQACNIEGKYVSEEALNKFLAECLKN